MAQIFHSSTNQLSRLSIVALAVAPLALILIFSAMSRTYGQRLNVPLEQPVPFSHQHHANELGIACKYCHTSVETSSNAGLPPTHTCMSCHSQIWTNSPLLEPVRESYQSGVPLQWVRVNDLPDFVYFNHSIHVTKGIPCQHCHGDVDEMQLTYKPHAFFMAWCLDCHRNPEQFIRPREEVYNFDYDLHQAIDDYWQRTGKTEPKPESQQEFGKVLVQDYHIKKDMLTDCWVCHR